MEPTKRKSDRARRYLIILDVNGLLCKKVLPGSKYRPSDPRIKMIKTNKYFLYIRPGVEQFINRLLDKYRVAIFSSTTSRNLEPILKILFNHNTLRRLAFIWDRSRTRHDPEFGQNPKIESHQTIKSLVDVWDNPMINPRRFWNQTNTLCIDHEFSKLRFNSPNNILICQEWESNHELLSVPSNQLEINESMSQLKISVPDLDTLQQLEQAIEAKLTALSKKK